MGTALPSYRKRVNENGEKKETGHFSFVDPYQAERVLQKSVMLMRRMC